MKKQMTKTAAAWAAVIAIGLSGGVQAQSTWQEIPVGVTNRLNAIDFASPAVGYIGGNDSLLLKTVDGGQTWAAVAYTGVANNGNINNVKFVNEQIGFMAIEPYSSVYKTVDGGQTWMQLDSLSGNMCYKQGMYFWNDMEGLVGGAGCFQGELMDRMVGGSWSAATLNMAANFDPTNRIVDIDFWMLPFVGADFGVAASTSGLVFRTIDAGVTWDTVRVSQYPLTSIAVINADTVIAGYDAGGSGFGVLMSTDKGLTWQEDMNSATFFYPIFQSVHGTTDGVLYAAGKPSWAATGVIFELNPDTTLGWTYEQVDQPIRAMSSAANSEVVFAVGDSGLVVVNRPLAVGVETIASATTETAVRLYPNPAKDVVFVDISANLLPETAEIWTMTGQRVGVLPLQNGGITVGHLAAGVYEVVLRGGGRQWRGRLVR